MLPAPDAERRLSKEDAKGSGNILNYQPKVSKAKMKSVVDCFVKCGFALTSLVPDEVKKNWMDR